MTLLLIAVAFFAAGVLAGTIWGRSRTADAADVAELATVREQLRQAEDRAHYLDSEYNTLGHQAAELRERAAVLEAQLQFAHQQAEETAANEERLTAEFERLAKSSLKESREELVKVAESSFKLAQQEAKGDLAQQQVKIEHLVKPVQENLDKLEAFIQKSEQSRNEQYGGLFEQLQTVAATSKAVQEEASSLKNVLRSSTSARGRWGELALRSVVEYAGMTEHVDFSEQSSVSTEDGRFRADMIINIPGGACIPIDAKVPFSAYEQALSIDDVDEQTRLMKEHARHFRAHVDSLIKRAYWEQYAPSCDFAILFVPGDALLDAAQMHDTSLSQYAIENKILLATPTTLIPILRMTAMNWAQHSQAENAAEIAAAGKELLRRLIKADEHLAKMGRALGTAVGSYNEFIGTYDTRVKSKAQQLSKLSGAGVQFKQLADVEKSPRELRKRNYDDDEENEAIAMLEITEHFEAS